MWRFLLFCLLPANFIAAQTVETVATHGRIVDGIHVDEAGNVYTTPGGLVNGIAIGKATPAGDFDPNFQGGFSGPIDIDADAEGRLYVTNYDDNTLKRFDPLSGEVETIASGLDGPAGLTLDEAGNVYLTCFGAPPAYSGDQVIRVTPDGNTEVWLETAEFFRPQGITFDHEGNLWVSNTPTGRIFKIDTATMMPELMFELGASVGNMIFRQADQKLYFASQGHHRIYRMSLEGELDTLAGSGAIGITDGLANEARFNRPLGLGFTASEDTLYVAEAARLRRIINLDQATSTVAPSSVLSLRITPNPSHGRVSIEIPEALRSKELQLSITNSQGQAIREHSIPQATENIDIDALPSGVWYIRLHYENHIVAEKLLVL